MAARDRPSARLLDITRLASRAGRVLTGVDRVELAYARALVADPTPVFALCRTSIGFLLLERAGLTAFVAALDGADWGKPDLIARLSRLTDAAALGQSFLRHHAVARASRRGLQRLLRRLPVPTAYINVGHSNLTDVVLRQVAAMPDWWITILIHDTIPLDFPQMQRSGTVAAFAGKFRRTAQYADLILCPSQSAARDIAAHLATLDRQPPVKAVHLGVDITLPVALENLTPRDPYFVAVGTIEPRKNIALLLDVWEALGDVAPQLYICGNRGWRNKEVFARLDAGISGVTELGGLADSEIAALVQGARALLFPSLAEGFGLPPVEAAAIGVPVVCGDLAVTHEILDKIPTYLDASAPKLWKNAIIGLAEASPRLIGPEFVPPSWNTYFKTVLSMT